MVSPIIPPNRMLRLEESTAALVSAAATIGTVSNAVVQLVMNSLEVRPRNIRIGVDFQELRVELIDDGDGIDAEDLCVAVGEWHHTSKYQNVTESHHGQSVFDSRGRALAALRELSSHLVVESKARGASRGWRKDLFPPVYEDGHISTPSASASTCAPFGAYQEVELLELVGEGQNWHGTRVLVEGLFSRLPVRQHAIRKELELQMIREFVRRMSVIHHRISWSIVELISGNKSESSRRARNDARFSGPGWWGALGACVCKELLYLPPVDSVSTRIVNLHGDELLGKMRRVKVLLSPGCSRYSEEDEWKLEGYLSAPCIQSCHWTKECQYIFLNGRWLRGGDHGDIGGLLTRIYGLGLGVARESSQPIAKHRQSGVAAPISQRHPCFVLRLTCPQTAYEWITDGNSLRSGSEGVHFREWRFVEELVIKAILSFQPPAIEFFEAIGQWKHCKYKRLVESVSSKSALLKSNKVSTNEDEFHRSKNTSEETTNLSVSEKMRNSRKRNRLSGFDDISNNFSTTSDAAFSMAFLPDDSLFTRFRYIHDNDINDNLPSASRVDVAVCVDRGTNLQSHQNRTVITPIKTSLSFFDDRSREKNVMHNAWKNNEAFEVLPTNTVTPNNFFTSNSIEDDSHVHKRACLVMEDETLTEYPPRDVIQLEGEVDNQMVISDSQFAIVHDEDTRLSEPLSYISPPTEVFSPRVETLKVSANGFQSYSLVPQNMEDSSGADSIPSVSYSTHQMIPSLSRTSMLSQLTSEVVATNTSNNTLSGWWNEESLDRPLVRKVERSLALTRQDLDTAIPVGQFDKKFILTYCVHRHIILAFDQHAVDERIRFEDKLNQLELSQSGFNRDVVTNPVQHLIVDALCAAILKSHIHIFSRWGFKYKVNTNTSFKTPPSTSGSVGGYLLEMEQTGEVLGERLSIEDLVEFVEFVGCHPQGPESLWKPPAARRIAASQACRSAVKFGSSVSSSVCKQLLTDLRTTEHPFQCAHGRPSVCPLIDLAALSSDTQQSSDHPNQFRRIRPPLVKGLNI